MVKPETKSVGPRKRGRPGTNREKLLVAAVECLQQKGYAATTARDLVAASGTNLASIGYHFGSKEALLNEAISRGMKVWTASVEREMFAIEGLGLDARLERAFAAMVDRFGELEPYLVSFVEGFPPAVRSPELRATMAAAYEQARVAGGRMFERALEESDVPLGEGDAKVLAALMVAVCDGLILQWLLDPSRTPSSREIMAALRAVVPALGAAGEP